MRKTAWYLMASVAGLTALVSLRYFSLQPAVFIPGQATAYLANLGPLLLHIAGGTVALAVGPYQFLPNLRARRPRLHQALGRVYLAAVVCTAVGGLGLARIALGGPMARLGFAVMAVVLLTFTALAFAAIRGGEITTHRRWMYRSYAVVFSAVSFRVWLGVFLPFGLPFEAVYAVGAWVSWMVNVMAADLIAGRLARGRSARRGTPFNEARSAPGR